MVIHWKVGHGEHLRSLLGLKQLKFTQSWECFQAWVCLAMGHHDLEGIRWPAHVSLTWVAPSIQESSTWWVCPNIGQDALYNYIQYYTIHDDSNVKVVIKNWICRCPILGQPSIRAPMWQLPCHTFVFLEIDIHVIWGLASHDSDEDGADLGPGLDSRRG